MKTAFIIHGSFGNPNENWFPWLKTKLEEQGFKVIVPSFPTPQNQSLETWSVVFSKYLNSIDKDSIFIGHSLGPAFILSLLENIRTQVRGCFFVSGFLDLLGNETFDTLNKTFVDRTFDWQSIMNHCKYFKIYHSDTDPYVPLSSAQKLAAKLNSSVSEIANAGHFNEASGYTEFEQLLEDIKTLMKNPKPF